MEHDTESQKVRELVGFITSWDKLTSCPKIMIRGTADTASDGNAFFVLFFALRNRLRYQGAQNTQPNIPRNRSLITTNRTLSYSKRKNSSQYSFIVLPFPLSLLSVRKHPYVALTYFWWKPRTTSTKIKCTILPALEVPNVLYIAIQSVAGIRCPTFQSAYYPLKTQVNEQRHWSSL